MKIVTAAILALAMFGLAACGSDEVGGESETDSDSSEGTPVSGGTLTFGQFSSPRGLDPIVMTGYGTTGLVESLAVYDSILRWDADSQEYEPLTAESVTASEDSTEWVIKLRSDIAFTDGTPYDADAVVFNLNRQRSGQPGAPACEEIVACPQNSVQSAYAASFIADVESIDPLTVEVTLHQPWAGFDAALASELGLVASPTAIKECDPAAPPSDCDYNLKPVGAGPFVVTSFKPDDSIKMEKNTDYWGDEPHLDGLEFISLGDGGGQKTYEALKTGAIDSGFLRDPETVQQAEDDGTKGFLDQSFGAAALQMNAADGHPTSDQLVRQAVLAAVDQTQVSDRVYDGATDASPDLLTSQFAWYPGSVFKDPDAARAKDLADEAKDAGWDGKLKMVSNNTKTTADTALLVQAQLKNAGIDVDLDATRDVGSATELLVQGEFDLFLGGLGISNDGTAVLGLSKNFTSDSPSNRVGLESTEMDDALEDLLGAKGDDELEAAYKAVEEQISTSAPVAPIATYGQFIVWDDSVRGVESGIETSVYFGDAWIEK